MKFTVARASLLKPLQAVIGVVERRQTMPVLANVLLAAQEGKLTITATDLEVELVAAMEIDTIDVPGDITVPGRKLLDICRALPEQATVSAALEGDRLVIKSGRSRFVLSTLPAAEFPIIDDIAADYEIELEQSALGRLLEKTHFSMAQQDVRYYLNGLLIEADGTTLRAVATDGHRLALCDIAIDTQDTSSHQVIIPRKGVLELQRLLGDEGTVKISLGSNHARAELSNIRFTSKLIDGRFPDYDKVIPELEGNVLSASRDALRNGLQRAAILSNEKFRGVRLELRRQSLKIQANNPDQEEAEDEVEVDYGGEEMEIGFNVNYLLDALAAVDGDYVEFGVVDPNSSCLIHEPDDQSCKYVVMPMRL